METAKNSTHFLAGGVASPIVGECKKIVNAPMNVLGNLPDLQGHMRGNGELHTFFFQLQLTLPVLLFLLRALPIFLVLLVQAPRAPQVGVVAQFQV
jgi:hypothetical protein